MKALILVNGELYKPDVLRKRIGAGQFDLVLAADGGARYAEVLGVTTDAIIGDMDSLSSREEHGNDKTELVSYPVEKDEIDLELALLYAANKGADNIVMVGVMGGRMDMSIANILLLTHPELALCRIEVWHGEQTGWVIRPPGEDITGSPGDTLSLIPLSDRATGVTTREMKYPLSNETLSIGPGRGLSNILESESARVELSSGLLLAVHTPSEYEKGK
ncbi:thiamine diphosphokinase [Chloroflexota bacterium]